MLSLCPWPKCRWPGLPPRRGHVRIIDGKRWHVECVIQAAAKALATCEVPAPTAINALLQEGVELMRPDQRERWRQRAERVLTEQEGGRK